MSAQNKPVKASEDRVRKVKDAQKKEGLRAKVTKYGHYDKLQG